MGASTHPSTIPSESKRSQHLYRHLTADKSASYVLIPVSQPLHVTQHSTANLRRRLELNAPGAALVWYSGDSRVIGRGALLAYVPTAHDYWSWYVEYREQGTTWKMSMSKNIATSELDHLQAVSDA